jgi:uncharacterized phage-associated protein
MEPEHTTGTDRGERLRELVHYILSNYPDKRVSTRRLEKIVYVAELESIDRYGHRITDLDFIRHDYGPCSNELLRMAVEEFEHETFEVEGGEGRAFRKPRPTEYRLLEEKTIKILDTVNGRWAKKSPNALVEYSRSTDPYKDANLYSPIDFEKYKACSDALYRNPDLKADLDQARKDIENGNCVVIKNEDELEDYFASM